MSAGIFDGGKFMENLQSLILWKLAVKNDGKFWWKPLQNPILSHSPHINVDESPVTHLSLINGKIMYKCNFSRERKKHQMYYINY